MGLFDVHAHLTHELLRPQQAEILRRAEAAGVTTIISNGLNPIDNQRVQQLAQESSLVKPAFGLYPVDAVLCEMLAAGVDYPRDDEPVPADEGVAWVREHAEQSFAIGEIGLDGHWVPEQFWAPTRSSISKPRADSPRCWQARNHPYPQARGPLL